MNFIKKIRGVMLGNIIYSASQFLILLTLIKIGTLNDVGIFTFGLSIVTPISAFLGFQLRNQLTINTDNDLKLSDVISTRNMLNVLFLLIVIIFWINTQQLIFLFLGLYKIIEAYYEILYGLYLNNFENDKMGKLIIIKSLGSFICFVSVFYLSNNLIYAVLSQCIYLFVLLLYVRHYDYNKLNLFKFFINRYIVQFIRLSLPLAISALLIAITPQIPRYFLSVYSNIESVGIFSSITYLIVIGTLFINSINSSFFKTFSRYLMDNKYSSVYKLLRRNALIFIIIWILMNIIMALFGEILIPLIFSDIFLNYMFEIHIILFGSIFLFLSTLFINFTLYTKRYKLQLAIYTTTIISSLILGRMLIPSYSIKGAAIALAANYLIQFSISSLVYLYIKKDFKGKIH